MSEAPLPVEAVEALLRAFLRKDDQGRPVYAPREVKSFLALMFLSAGPPARLPEWAQTLVTDLAQDLGLTPDSPPDEIDAALKGHFEKNPPHPELLQEATRLAERYGAAILETARAVAQVELGEEKPAPPPPQKDVWGGSNDS